MEEADTSWFVYYKRRFRIKFGNGKPTITENKVWSLGKNNNFTINFANINLHILDIRQIQQAERCIIKLVQSKYFNEEMKKLLMKKQGSEWKK